MDSLRSPPPLSEPLTITDTPGPLNLALSPEALSERAVETAASTCPSSEEKGDRTPTDTLPSTSTTHRPACDSGLQEPGSLTVLFSGCKYLRHFTSCSKQSAATALLCRYLNCEYLQN